MEDAKGVGDSGGRRRRTVSEIESGAVSKLYDRRRSTDTTDGCCSRIPIRSPASTPTMPRRLPGFSIARHNKYSQSLRSLDKDDTESLGGRSSCDCDHAHFPSNGTTFSARTRKFVVHCSPSHCSSSPDEYLTPTQRANATIRKLRTELHASQTELTEREREITRLTKEIVQLRLRKLDDVDDLTDDDQGIRPSGFRPIRLCNEATTICDGAPFVIATIPPQQGSSSSGSEVPTSLVDSGHFEELSPYNSPRTSALEKEIDRLKTEHESEVKQIKDDTDAQIDELMKKLTEANLRCEELKPQLEDAKLKLAELEKEKTEIKTKFEESEEKHRQDYLQMYNKGQQAVIMDGDPSTSDGPPSDIPTLLKQLEVTRQELNSVKTMYRRMLENKKSQQEQDAEITLKFLKSAIFYFLTDRENAAGHLAAIQSILGFNEDEKAAIDKNAYLWKY